MTTLDKALTGVLEQAPFIIALAIICWLSLPQLAERFAIIGKLLRPLSRRWRDKAERLEAARHEAAMVEARKLAVAAMQEMTPPDVRKLTDRLIRVEDAEELLRAFVIYDELWHFKDDHNEARQGRIPAHRITFDLFEQKWHQGWRPFDDDGRLVDDGT